ncbi:MAG: haloacid dehalogenase type II [Rhizobiales bacterium]|nr:haloacid dehalogenase type II [Hyphomicrobiales bacterium]
MPRKLTDFKVLTFDCYGTLIDWESGMFTALASLTSRLPTPLSRDAILEAHARHESAQQADTPAMRYSELLAVVYARLAAEWGLTITNAEAAAYGSSVGNWPAFPDSAGALKDLQKHFKLVILSNVDRASFARSNEKLGVTFDAIVTAEDVGAYKPSDLNFDELLRTITAMGLTKGDILHTAESLFHDHVPAARHGLARCWIHRRHAQGGFGATRPVDNAPDVDFRFTSMREMADAVAKEAAAG